MRNDMNLLVTNDNRMSLRDSFVLKQILISLHFISFSWNLSKAAREAKVLTAVWPHPEIFCFGLLEDSCFEIIIPVTNIAELVEWVLLPYNEEGTKHVP